MTDNKSGQINIPPKGTRGARVADFFFKLMKPLAGMEVGRYKKATGAEQKMFMGFPVLVLTTVGAKTGQERSTVLGGFPDGDNAWLIIGSKGGSPDHPGWLYNIAKNPDKVWVQVGNRKLKVSCESLTGKEREEAYARVASEAKAYAGYPKKTDREIPVLRLTATS